MNTNHLTLNKPILIDVCHICHHFWALDSWKVFACRGPSLDFLSQGARSQKVLAKQIAEEMSDLDLRPIGLGLALLMDLWRENHLRERLSH